MNPPLLARLGLRQRDRDRLPSPYRAAVARAGFYLFVGGATIALLSAITSGGLEQDQLGLLSTALAAYTCSAVCLLVFDRLPAWSIHVLTGAAALLITSSLYFGGEGNSHLRLLYVWLGLFSAYFFRWRHAALHIFFVAVAYGIFLIVERPAAALMAWLLLVATLAVAAALVILLRRRLGRMLAVEREQNERLRKLDRLKDEFVASVSHELRTPLTSIRGYLELVLEEADGRLTEEQRHFLTVVERNTERLLRLVADLLFAAQVHAGQLTFERTTIEVAQIAAQSIEAARPVAADKGIELALEQSPLPPLEADPARLAQLLDNLVSNALKFTPAGGQVHVRAFREDGRAVLEVEDSGLGIAPEEQEHLFERFFRTRAASEQAIQGTGLGLSIAQAIAEGHGGTIAVTSAEGVGTTFRVELPLSGRTQVARELEKPVA